MPTSKTFNLTSGQTILVVSPLYDQIEKLTPLFFKRPSNSIWVFLGDTAFPYTQTHEIVFRINSLQVRMENQQVCYIAGDHDLTFANKHANIHVDVCDWIMRQPRILKCSYPNGSNYLFLHGGIKPDYRSIQDIENDPESSFLIDWHKQYDGRFGYVVSAHSTPSQKYPYSMSLDTEAWKTKRIAVQEITENGLGSLSYY